MKVQRLVNFFDAINKWKPYLSRNYIILRTPLHYPSS